MLVSILFEGVFDQILLKTAKNYRFETFSKFAHLPSPHFEKNWTLLTFSDLLFIKFGSEKVCLVLVDSKQSYARKTFGDHLNPLPLCTGRVKGLRGVILTPLRFFLDNSKTGEDFSTKF